MEKKVFKAESLQESHVLANFEVEELEKRFEMGWSVDAYTITNDNGNWEGFHVGVLDGNDAEMFGVSFIPYSN